MSQEGVIKLIENAVRTGVPLLIEDMPETLDSILDPLLLGNFVILNRRKTIKIGDQDVEFDNNFKLFLCTKSSNPHFLPETFIRVSVVNFTVTLEGLEEQLLGEVVNREKPEVERIKSELIIEVAKGKLNLKKNEARILELLTNSKGMILDNIDLIENLKLSKLEAELVKEKLVECEKKTIEID